MTHIQKSKNVKIYPLNLEKYWTKKFDHRAQIGALFAKLQPKITQIECKSIDYSFKLEFFIVCTIRIEFGAVDTDMNECVCVSNVCVHIGMY